MNEQPNHREAELALALEATERRLNEARLQIAELEELLEELPVIFERKFQQRLQPVLERQQLLQANNADLQRQLRQLAAAPDDSRNPVPAESTAGNGNEADPADRADSSDSAGSTSTGISSLVLPQLPSRSAERRSRRRRRAA